ncbi:MAG: hypothetical protein JKY37_28075 [Nannocystaceae bacterium]|nr:hypothetical protein [Nannocystaceae bacterium]
MDPKDLSGDRLTLETLSAQLAQALGEEKARDVIWSATSALGLRGPALTRQEALNVLAEVADTPGIVGICARFARTRLLLASVSASLKR